MKFTRKQIIILFSGFLLSAAFFYFFQKPPKVEAGWFDESWLYRQIISITNSGVVQTDFQTMITLDSAALITAGKMQSDCDDIRLTDISGKLLSHWMEPGTCNTTSTKIWVKVPSIPASGASVYLYYGNSSAVSVSSATNTFVREISGVQGAWNMDEASWTNDCSTDTAFDSSGNANHGKSCPNAGGTQPAAAKFGNGGVFDGSNDYVNMGNPSSLRLTGSMSVSAWVYTISFGSGNHVNPRVVTKSGNPGNRGWDLNIENSTSKMHFQISSDGTNQEEVITTGNVPTGQWVHYVGVYEAGVAYRIYVNGILNNSNTVSIPASQYDATNNVWIGGRTGCSNCFFDGSIDEVRVYNRALSDAEISDLYGTGSDRQGYTTTNYPNKVLVRKYSASVSAGAPASEERGPGPVAYWKFDEGFGQTANDSTINANNGTLGATSGVEASDPVWQTEDMCVTGKCLKFDGTDDYVDAGNGASLNITDAFTIEAWIKAGTSGADQMIVDKYRQVSSFTYGYGISLTGTGVIQLRISRPGPDFIITANNSDFRGDGLWHHIVATSDPASNIMVIYLDGIGIATGDTISPAVASSNLQIGRRVSGTYWFNGFIDDVKIYSYARTAAQIKTDYASRGTAKGASVVIGSGAAPSLSNGLVGYWKMDEASWTNDCSTASVLDASGAGNNGKACPATTGPVGAGAGKFGNGGSFDGTDDYVRVEDSASLDITDNLTLSAWVNTNSVALAEQPIIIKGNGGTSPRNYELEIAYDEVRMVYYSGSWRFPTTVNANLIINTWYHLVYVRTGGREYIYVNGVNKLDQAQAAALLTNNYDLRIGDAYYGAAANEIFNGSIDEVKVYNRALSPKEVRDLYNFAPGPVGYWKMDDPSTGSGQAKADSSGYNNNGTTYSANGTGMNCNVPGKYGKGCQFDGVDDYVNVGNGANLNIRNAITIEGWAKFNSLTALWPDIASKGVYRLNKENIVWRTEIYIGGAKITSGGTTVIQNNVWYHVASTYDGVNLNIYVNGVLEHSTATTGLIDINASPLTISSTTYPLDGIIDDVRIYNYARTQKQIVEDMSARGGSAVGGLAGSGQGAVGYWKFDEGYGITANNSGFGGSALNGTLTGMASPATTTSGWTNSGKFGKALNFDGTNDYVDAGNNAALNITNNITVEAWEKGAPNLNQGTVVSKSYSPTNHRSFYFVTGDITGDETKLRIVMTDDGTINTGHIKVYQSSLTAFDNTWHHVAFTFSSGTLKLYVDGVQDTNPTKINDDAITSLYATDASVEIGARNLGTSNFNGTIDEVKVYNFALTEDEIKLDYNQGAAVKLGSISTASNGITPDNSANRSYCIPGDTSTCNPPVGEWNFDEKTGQSANDISGNVNIGTLGSTGGADSADPTWTSGKIGGALKFDGVDDYVSYGTNVSSYKFGMGSFTISGWFKGYISGSSTIAAALFGIRASGTTSRYALALSKRYGYLGFQIIDDNGVQAPASDTTTNYLNGNWHYGVMVVDRTNNIGKLYGDGIQTGGNIDISTLTGNISPQGLALTGDIVFGSPDFFNGSIDDIRIYNYARTPAQVAWDYNRGKPVAEWKFDECQGNIANDSSGNNNGTITIGATVPQTVLGTCTAPTDGTGAWYNGRNGKINSAMSFDGADDYMTINDPNSKLDLINNLSISAWVYPTGTPSGPLPRFTIFHKGGNSGIADPGGYSFVLYGANRQLEFVKLNVVEIWSTKTVPINEWHNVAVTYDGANVKFYYDGSLAQTINDSQAINGASSMNAYIGTYLYDPGLVQYFQGQIDDVKIYNYALTPLQVKDAYNSGAVNFR